MLSRIVEKNRSQTMSCDETDSRLAGNVVLCISPPETETHARLQSHLAELGVSYAQPYPNVLAIPLDPEGLYSFIVGLRQVLSEAELRDARSLIMPAGTTPTVADVMRMQRMSTFVAGFEGRWLSEVLAEHRLVTHFMPIVRTEAPEVVFAYECLLRARTEQGELIDPGRLFSTARNTELLFHLDRAARLTAIRDAQKHGVSQTIFINFHRIAIYDPAYCLRPTVSAVGRAGIAPERIVFEVVDSDELGNISHLQRILDTYRGAGFRVALDDLRAGHSGSGVLQQLRPDFIKLDIELIRGVHEDPERAAAARALVEQARAIGAQSIGEGVETEGEWHWCRDNGVDYVSGYFFAAPATPPPVPRRLS